MRLVGSSGAGKSTLADLIPRFHDVTGGELLVDGINIKNYSLHALRGQMSIVTQEPVLFNDTIAANIALGTPDASPEEIEQAAKVANAHQFIIQKEERISNKYRRPWFQTQWRRKTTSYHCPRRTKKSADPNSG